MAEEALIDEEGKGGVPRGACRKLVRMLQCSKNAIQIGSLTVQRIRKITHKWQEGMKPVYDYAEDMEVWDWQGEVTGRLEYP